MVVAKMPFSPLAKGRVVSMNKDSIDVAYPNMKFFSDSNDQRKSYHKLLYVHKNLVKPVFKLKKGTVARYDGVKQFKESHDAVFLIQSSDVKKMLNIDPDGLYDGCYFTDSELPIILKDLDESDINKNVFFVVRIYREV